MKEISTAFTFLLSSTPIFMKQGKRSVGSHSGVFFPSYNNFCVESSKSESNHGTLTHVWDLNASGCTEMNSGGWMWNLTHHLIKLCFICFSLNKTWYYFKYPWHNYIQWFYYKCRDQLCIYPLPFNQTRFFNYHWLQDQFNKRTNGSHCVILLEQCPCAPLGHPYVCMIVKS